MSGCKSCNDKKTSDRYGKPEVKTKQTDLDKRIEAFDKVLDKDLPVDNYGPYSLDTLLSMKESAEKIEFEKFRITLNKMAYDERIFHVIGLVDLINGKQYSPLGHSPTYCICLLHKLLDFPEFACVNTKFPGLKEAIGIRFLEIESTRLTISI